MHGVHFLDMPETPGPPARRHRVLPRLSARRRSRAHRGSGAGARSRKASMFARFTLPASRIATRRDFVASILRDWSPQIVLNATAFSARLDDAPSPLEAAGAPILQVVFAGSSREAWQDSPRGLSQSDLAMQVVLPELDGRLLTTAISFKAEESEVAGLEFARVAHRPGGRGHRRRRAQRRRYGRDSPPRHALSASSRWSCPIIRAQQGKPPTQWASTPSPAPPRSCSFSRPRASTVGDALPDSKTTRRRALRCRVRLRSSRSPTISACSRPSMPMPAPRSSPPGARRTTIPRVRDGHFTMRFARHGRLIAAIQPDRGNALDRKVELSRSRPAAAPRLRRLLSLAARDRAHPRA